jgi:cytidylate kinase
MTILDNDDESNNNKSPGSIKIIISGAPASGKGTQCEIIKEKFGVVHLSTGDMLRAAVAAQTQVGIAAKEYMDSGRLVPDNVIIGVVSSLLIVPACRTVSEKLSTCRIRSIHHIGCFSNPVYSTQNL